MTLLKEDFPHPCGMVDSGIMWVGHRSLKGHNPHLGLGLQASLPKATIRAWYSW